MKFGLMEFYPFGRASRENGFEGIYSDIIQEIQKLSDVRMETIALPIPRLRDYLSEGKIDLTIAGASSSTIEGAVSLGVIGCSRIIVQTSNMSGIHDLSDLKGKFIGFLANGFLYKEYGTKFGLTPVQVTSNKSMFAMLALGRLDGIFISDVVIDSNMQDGFDSPHISSNWRDKIGARIELKKVPSHLQISRQFNNADINRRLADAVIRGHEIGTFEKIYATYGVRTKGKC